MKRPFQFGWLWLPRVYLLISSPGLAGVKTTLANWCQNRTKIHKIHLEWNALLCFSSVIFYFLPLVEVVASLPLIYAASIRVKPEGKPRGQQSAFIYRSVSARQGDRAEAYSLDVDGVTGRWTTQSSTHRMQSALTLCSLFLVPSGADRRSRLTLQNGRVKQICTAALPTVQKSQVHQPAVATLWLKRGTMRPRVSEQSSRLELDV